MGSLFIRVIRGKTHFNGLRRTAGVTVRATHRPAQETGRANSLSKNKPAYEM